MRSNTAPYTMLKTSAFLLIMLALSMPFLCEHRAYAQTEYWNTKERKRSQDLSSSALNHLKNLYAGKRSKKKGGDLEEAIQLLERATATDPDDPLPHYLLGLAFTIDGNYPRALSVFQKANKLDPQEYEILLGTGLAQHLSGNYQRAIAVWSKLLGRTDRKAPVYVLIGHAKLRGGDLEGAIESFSKAQDLEAGLQSAQHGMATVYFLSGDLDKAESTAISAQSIYKYPPISLVLAEISYLKGEKEKAVKYLKEYRSLTKKFGPHKSMTEIGFSTQHDFQWDPFIVDSYDLDDSIKARESMRASMLKKSSPGKGSTKLASRLSNIDKKLASMQDDFYINHEKGLLLLAQGDYKNAASCLEKAVKICPSDQIDLLNLSTAYSFVGKPDLAGPMFKKYRSVYSNNKLSDFLNSLAVTPNTDDASHSQTKGKKSKTKTKTKTKKTKNTTKTEKPMSPKPSSQKAKKAAPSEDFPF